MRILGLPEELGHVVYWAGPREAVVYELTITATGGTRIRYLPAGTAAGGAPDGALAVATDPQADAYLSLLVKAEEDGAMSTDLDDGAMAVGNTADPFSAFLARPVQPFRVEVNFSEEGEAWSLASNGEVVPVSSLVPVSKER